VPHLVTLSFELVAKHKNNKGKEKIKNKIAHLTTRTTTMRKMTTIMKKLTMRKQTHHVVCTF
jgi:hypothetical protein